jgi:hypothetical protein
MKRIIIEGVLLSLLGLLGLVESVKMIIRQDPKAFWDIGGATRYLIGVSIALMITGVIHIIWYRRRFILEKLTVNREILKQVIRLTIIMVVYCLLLKVVGYFLGTAVFFFLMLWVLGVASWLKNIILTMAFSSCFYIIFKLCLNMILPRGILLK